MTRFPVAMAGLALVAVTAVACGSDDGDDATAADPSASSSATSAPSASDSPTESPSASATYTQSGDPVPSPVINKAVKAAIRDGYPALVPAGVPAGWTVVSAAYHSKAGTWQITLTDPNGDPVSLRQSTADIATQVAQLPDVQPAGTVDLSDYGTGTWKAYSGTGIAVLAKKLSGTSVVVVGTDQDTVVELAQELLTAEDAGNGDDGG